MMRRFRFSPRLAGSPRSFDSGQSRRAGVNERSPRALLVNLLEVDDKLVGIVLSIRENFGAEEGDDVLAYDIAGLALEIRVVYAEMSVEPVDLVGDEVGRNESLGAG